MPWWAYSDLFHGGVVSHYLGGDRHEDAHLLLANALCEPGAVTLHPLGDPGSQLLPFFGQPEHSRCAGRYGGAAGAARPRVRQPGDQAAYAGAIHRPPCPPTAAPTSSPSLTS